MNKKLINIVKGDIKSAIKQGNYNREVARHSNIEFDTESKQILLDGIAYSNPSMVTLTYNKLYTLREDNELIPGVFYKITDVTSAIKPGSEYEDYQFDVIVLALSTNTLSEDAYAMLHGDLSEDVNLSKWKVKYTLDNDKSKFSWANNTVDNSTYGTITSNDFSSEPVTFEFTGLMEYLEPYNYFGWEDGLGNIVFTRSYEVHVGDTLYRNGDLIPVGTIASIEYVHQGTGLPNGRGVIYDIIESEKKNDSLIEVTWQNLKTLRDNSQLIPGSFYRITDYNCTTTQENTRSAGHQFDIVLFALSEDKLAEEGWAMEHPTDVYDVTFEDGVTKKCYIYKRDELFCNIVDINTLFGTTEEYVGQDAYVTINEESKTCVCTFDSSDLNVEDCQYNYFQYSNLSAWKVWYSLDNDADRFVWADDRVETVQAYITTTGAETMYHRNAERDRDGYFAWYGRGGFTYYTTSETPSVGDDIYYINSSKVVLSGESVASYTPEEILDYYGRGVIYRLIDEWDNDCPYDFKNIQFVLVKDWHAAFYDGKEHTRDASLDGTFANNKVVPNGEGLLGIISNNGYDVKGCIFVHTNQMQAFHPATDTYNIIIKDGADLRLW